MRAAGLDKHKEANWILTTFLTSMQFMTEVNSSVY